jgi:predicted dienelactone hydrolase
MFRNAAVAAADVAKTPRAAASFGENAMALGGVPRLEVIAGMERPVVVYDGPSAQNFAPPSTRLRLVPNHNGSLSTLRG